MYRHEVMYQTGWCRPPGGCERYRTDSVHDESCCRSASYHSQPCSYERCHKLSRQTPHTTDSDSSSRS